MKYIIMYGSLLLQLYMSMYIYKHYNCISIYITVYSFVPPIHVHMYVITVLMTVRKHSLVYIRILYIIMLLYNLLQSDTLAGRVNMSTHNW